MIRLITPKTVPLSTYLLSQLICITFSVKFSIVKSSIGGRPSGPFGFGTVTNYIKCRNTDGILIFYGK